MLRNLTTPCRDVDEISKQLQLAHWNFDNADPDSEIHTYCDADIGTIRLDIEKHIANFNHPNDLLIIYLAGHGAEVAGRDYFFGPFAKLDLGVAASLLRESSQNRLFVGQALDIFETVSAPAGVFYHGNILVIFGACRDDPVTYHALGAGLNMTILPALLAGPPPGERVLFATMPGGLISDGVGLSELARSLSARITPDHRVYDVIRQIGVDVRMATKDHRPIETPTPLGDFSNIDICFSGCLHSSATKDLEIGPKILRMASFESAKGNASYLSQHVSPTLVDNPPAGFTIIRPTPSTDITETLKATPIGVDLYSCESGGAARHLQTANDMALTLAGLGDAHGIAGPGTMLGSVRVQTLPDIDNARPGLRYARNTVRYSSGSAAAKVLATRVQKLAKESFYVEALPTADIDTVNVFVCSGGQKYPTSQRLFIQAAKQSQRGIGLFLSGTIERENPNLWVADAVDIRPLTRAHSPNHTQVRFYADADGAVANSIGKSLNRYLPRPVSVVQIKLRSVSAKKTNGLIEIWIGRDLDPDSVKTE